MKDIRNRIDLCFELLTGYEEKIKKAILMNGMSEEDTNEIMSNFHFKNELLFSLNKEYKKGRKLEDFCKVNSLSTMIPEMLKFNHSLYKHQENAIESIAAGKCTVVSTGTGSGKTESFLIPILDYCIKNKNKKGVKAIIIYPMNALAGDQLRRIEEVTKDSGITFAIFNGETPRRDKGDEVHTKDRFKYREDIVENKPDILITNYVMLERILVNSSYSPIFKSEEKVFKYIVLDEIHTYNGNIALHIKYLLHRLRHIVDTKVVQIGCSATLSRNKDGQDTGGYISGEIDEFIINMFDLKSQKDYSYIEPIYEEVLNSNYHISDEKYLKVQKDDKTKIIKTLLASGCKSFKEILNELRENQVFISEEELRAYFIEVLDLNEKYKNMPILDFRIHLFLLEIGKYLRRCIKCGKYYTSEVNKCNDCGHLILPVYKDNPKLLLGVLKNGEIRGLSPFDEDEDKDLVLLNFNKDEGLEFEHILRFDDYELRDNAIKLNINKSGIFQVYGDANIEESIICLGWDKIYDYFYNLLKTNFKYLNKKDKKILGFIDNREACGRYSTIFGDNLLSEFYLEVLKYCNDTKTFSLIEIKEAVINAFKETLENKKDITEEVKELIFQDFHIWFRRLLVNYSKQNELKLYVKDEENYDEVKRFVISTALKEGVFFQENLKEYGKVIRVSRKSFEFSKGIAFKSFENKNAIVLSSKGTKYKASISKFEYEEIRRAIRELVQEEILVQVVQNEENKKPEEDEFLNSIFYLNMNKVTLDTAPSEYNSLSDIIEGYLLFTGAHTSEVDKEVKKFHEEDFQNGNINLLLATPTLEMGIDIGSLSFIYMVGVPRLPSNYAQRAGRAGRRGDRFAGIITICSERSNHDWYYFYNPKEMVEGVITPPRFDINNEKVLYKHMNTIIYPKVKKKLYSSMDLKEKLSLQKNCEEIFSKDKGIHMDSYLQWLQLKMDNKNFYTNKQVYDNAIYPEYCFSSKEVELIEEYKVEGQEDKGTVVLGTREPELAYKQIVPKAIMFIGERYYVIEPYGKSDTFTSLENTKVLSSWKYLCKDNEKNIKFNKEGIIPESYILIQLDKGKKGVKAKGPLKIYHDKNMRIEFIAEAPYGDTALVGYQLIRDTIIFEFDRKVISSKQYISLMALLVKTIKYQLGLEENEISLIMNEEVKVISPYKTNYEGNGKAYVLIYDKTGNDNVNMGDILNRVIESMDNKDKNTLLYKAYEKISKCDCEKQTGCYLCIKSHNTQRYSHILDKDMAKNFIGYLIGRERLRPKVVIEEEISTYELKINVKPKGKDIILKTRNTEEVYKVEESQNSTIFTALYHKLKSIYKGQDVETLLITSPVDYIVNGINEKDNIKVEDESLKLFMFYKQAFKAVLASKGSLK